MSPPIVALTKGSHGPRIDGPRRSCPGAVPVRQVDRGGGAGEQHPRIDPYATLIFQTTAADVRTVLVDGRVVKRDGVLTGVDLPRLTADADTAAEAILGRVRDAGRALPGTPPGAFEALEPVARGFRDEAVRAAKAGR
jgi:hypothetical protein